MTERVVASGTAVALALLVFGCGGNASSSVSNDEPQALVRLPGGASRPARGGWYGMRGIFEPYRDGSWVQVAFRVQNRASDAITLLSASQPQHGPRLLRLIGVRFDLAPIRGADDCGFCPVGPTGLDRPYGPVEPDPVVVPPGREAFVQFNFEMGDCQFFAPGTQERYNETATFRYALDRREETATLDLTGITITVTAPTAEDCPGAT